MFLYSISKQLLGRTIIYPKALKPEVHFTAYYTKLQDEDLDGDKRETRFSTSRNTLSTNSKPFVPLVSDAEVQQKKKIQQHSQENPTLSIAFEYGTNDKATGN